MMDVEIIVCLLLTRAIMLSIADLLVAPFDEVFRVRLLAFAYIPLNGFVSEALNNVVGWSTEYIFCFCSFFTSLKSTRTAPMAWETCPSQRSK